MVYVFNDTYTLKVTLKFTRPDGKRVTKNSVSRVDYHTCTAKPPEGNSVLAGLGEDPPFGRRRRHGPVVRSR